ncbi:hypothetical protein Taro_013578 [Colocasia esculenta]|uniref:Uncharacterized protein n=1 Tax=Colocasia esculenta TaxID=4460 RepID=A0A843UJ63_COLES|nr:hypothetical protein [Colocasia esculenta]
MTIKCETEDDTYTQEDGNDQNGRWLGQKRPGLFAEQIPVKSYSTYIGDDTPSSAKKATRPAAGGRSSEQKPLRISLQKETTTQRREANEGAEDEDAAAPQLQLRKSRKLERALEAKKKPNLSSAVVEPLTVEEVLSEMGLSGGDVVIVDDHSDRDSTELAGVLEPLMPTVESGATVAAEGAQTMALALEASETFTDEVSALTLT